MTHVVMEVKKSQICGVGWQFQDAGELMVYIKFEGSLLDNFSLA